VEMVAGLQESNEGLAGCAIVMVDPAAEIARPPPLASAATGPVKLRFVAVLCVEAEMFNVATATTPLAIVVAFNPKMTQVMLDGPPVQLMLLFALTAAAPATKLMLVMSAAVTVAVNCNEAGALPLAVFIDMLTVAVPPGTPEAAALLMVMLADSTEVLNPLTKRPMIWTKLFGTFLIENWL